MQTFLPLSDFYKSFWTLDRKRLGNQVYREGKTLLDGGWANHPASKMWRGHERALATYCFTGAVVMGERDWFKDDTVFKWRVYFKRRERELPNTGMPRWLGDLEFHASHRSNLLRKDPEWYGQFGWNEPHDLEYIWPTP